MHKLKVASALAAGMLSAVAASAAQVTLDFSGATGTGSVNNFYNGGTDSYGAAGTNYGVSFSPSVLAFTNDGSGPGTNGQFFSNAPGGANTAIMANAPDVAAVMNVAGGFSGSLGLAYASVQAPTVVNIWSGLDGQGSLLATFSLAANSDGCDAGTPACLWATVTNSFSGVAKSVDFSSNATQALFTNITFTPVPLPAAGLLLSFGLSGLGLMRKRRRAA